VQEHHQGQPALCSECVWCETAGFFYSSSEKEEGSMSLSHFPHHEAAIERFLAVMQESADLFWYLSPTGEMQEICPSWQTFTGQQEQDCLGRGWLDAFHPADQSQVEATFSRSVASGHTAELECHICRYDRT
jgi:hypothetical protein